MHRAAYGPVTWKTGPWVVQGRVVEPPYGSEAFRNLVFKVSDIQGRGEISEGRVPKLPIRSVMV